LQIRLHHISAKDTKHGGSTEIQTGNYPAVLKSVAEFSEYHPVENQWDIGIHLVSAGC